MRKLNVPATGAALRDQYCCVMTRLDKIDLDATLGKDEYEKRLAAAQQRFLELRLELGGHVNPRGDQPGKIGPGLLVVLEGSDAGGKGGAIKRMVGPLDPRHYSVYSYAAPSERDMRHHFLWRFWAKVPGTGGMCVFDRSWYGRVLVERVEGFASRTEWTRAYDEIVNFERGIVDEGVILVKFWMQVSPDEQLKRFESRADDPLRKWKLTDEDWRNRDKRDVYDEAAEEMFDRTDHAAAPWDVISADQKKWARIAVLETTIKRIEAGLELWNERSG
jgi:polyphosphate kinase 2 (PPK2 family)